MARSISAASRRLTGLNSTPSDGATAWIAANWPIPAVRLGSRRTAARVTPGAISLSSSSHFPLMLYSNCNEAGGVAARSRQTFDEAGADRIDRPTRTRSVRCGSPAATAQSDAVPVARMTSGASATNSAACLRMTRHRPRPSGCRSARCDHRSSPIAAVPAGTRRRGPALPDRRPDPRAHRCAASGPAAARAPRAATPQPSRREGR